MANKTGIGWCDSTLNLMHGCRGCELWNKKKRTCYAGILTEKRYGYEGWPPNFERPAIYPERMRFAESWSDLRGKKRQDKPWIPDWMPRLVFLNDMGDTFTQGLDPDWLAEFIPVLESTPHIYQILTKRPRRMRAFFKRYGHVPANFWIGVSVTDQRTMDARVPLLLDIDARIRFVSFEPMLQPASALAYLAGLSWVIFGGESGLDRVELDLGGLARAVDECRRFYVPVFVKQDSHMYPGMRGRIAESFFVHEFPDLPEYSGPARNRQLELF